jgi:hypothetical protein
LLFFSFVRTVFKNGCKITNKRAKYQIYLSIFEREIAKQNGSLFEGVALQGITGSVLLIMETGDRYLLHANNEQRFLHLNVEQVPGTCSTYLCPQKIAGEGFCGGNS